MESNEQFRIFCGIGQDDKSHQIDFRSIMLGLMLGVQTPEENIETTSMSQISQTPLQTSIRVTIS